MARRVFLHIGAPKSGTTYLQTILWRNRGRLRRAGVLVPGRGLGDYNRAAVAMRTETLGDGGPARAWRAMLEQTHAFDGDVVMSGEWFCRAPAHLVGRTVEQLAPAEVHVVYSARSFVSQVTAAWQETLKLGNPAPLDDFVDGLVDGRGEERARWSWWTLDPRTVLERWLPEVPADRTSVVTVPTSRSEPDLLLRRFGAAFGIDVAPLDTSRGSANESLSVEAAEVLRAVAPRVKDLVDFSQAHWNDEYRWLRRYLSHDLLVRAEGHRIALRPHHVAQLQGRSAEVARWIEQRGLAVHGALSDLTGGGNAPGALHPSEVDATAQLAVAVPVMAALVRDVRAATLAGEAEQQGSGA